MDPSRIGRQTLVSADDFTPRQDIDRSLNATKPIALCRSSLNPANKVMAVAGGKPAKRLPRQLIASERRFEILVTFSHCCSRSLSYFF
jgi:hypothetical protein